jgi:hypothetical protein
MAGLVLEGVRLLRAESVATIPAVANTYAAARAGGARAGCDSAKISAESSSLVPIVGYTSQHKGIALHQVSAAIFLRYFVSITRRRLRSSLTGMWKSSMSSLALGMNYAPAHKQNVNC